MFFYLLFGILFQGGFAGFFKLYDSQFLQLGYQFTACCFIDFCTLEDIEQFAVTPCYGDQKFAIGSLHQIGWRYGFFKCFDIDKKLVQHHLIEIIEKINLHTRSYTAEKGEILQCFFKLKIAELFAKVSKYLFDGTTFLS